MNSFSGLSPVSLGEVADAYLEASLKKKPCGPRHLIDRRHQWGPCLAYQQIISIPDLMHRSQNLSQELIGRKRQKHDSFATHRDGIFSGDFDVVGLQLLRGVTSRQGSWKT